MALRPEIAELVLRIRTERESLNRATADIEKLRADMLRANAAIRDSIRPGPEFSALRDEFQRTQNVAAQLNAEMAAVGRVNRLKDLARGYVDVTRGGIRAEEAQASLNRELSRMNASTGEIRQVAQEIDRVGKAAERASAQSGRLFSGGRLQGGALGRLGSELRLLPSVPIPGTSFGSDSIANTLRISGALNTVMKSLGITLGQVAGYAGVTTVALGTIALAVDAFQASTRQFKTGMEAAIAAQDAYYEALLRNTSEVTRQAIADLERATDIKRQQQAETRNALGAFFVDPNQSLAERLIQPVGVQLARAFLGGGANIDRLQEQYNDLDEEIAKNEQTITRLTQGLEGNTFAANDFREGLERLRDIFAAPDAFEVVSGFRDISQDIVRTLTNVFTIGEADIERARENRIAGLERELAILQLASDQEQTFADIRRAGVGEIDNLAEQLRGEQARLDLANAQIPVLQQLAEENDTFTQRLEATKDELELAAANVGVLTERLGELRATAEVQKGITFLIDAGREYNALLQKQTDDIAKINARFAERQADLLARAEEADLDARLRYEFDYDKLTRDFDARNLEAEIETQRKEQAVRDDFNDRREKQLAEHNRKLAEIERGFQFDFTTAVGNRDALAANEAERRRQKEIDDENARFEGLRAEREKEQEQRIEELRANADAERDERQRDLKRRQDELARAFRFEQDQRVRKYNTDLRQLTDKYNAEIRLQNQAFNAELQQLQGALYAQFSLHQQFWNAAIGVAQRAVQSISGVRVSAANPAPGSAYIGTTPVNVVTSPSFYDIQRNMGVPGFAAGLDYVPHDNFMARLHKGERVLTSMQARAQDLGALYSGASRGRRFGGSVAMTMHIDGEAMTKMMDGRAVRVVAQVIEG